VALLTGQEGYDFINRFADTPTDPILAVWYIEKYYLATKDDTVWRALSDALRTLCAGETYIWLVPYYVLSYINYEKRNHYQVLSLVPIKHAFNQGVIQFKESLIKNTDWMGRNEPEGLYGDMLRMNHQLKENYGYALLEQYRK
jgi:hypothetical protein